MQAIILAAGISSRMRPLTDHTPKPMLRLGGKPIMEYVVKSLVLCGISDILITTHYLPNVIGDYFGNGSSFGAKITYSYEKNRLDTAGSLRYVKDWINGDFLVCGGHFVLPKLNLKTFIRFHKLRGGKCSIVFKKYLDEDNLCFFGQGILDENNLLVTFKEKPRKSISNLIHTTYQIFHKDVINLIPEGPCGIPDTLIPKMLEKNISVFGYLTNSELINVSTIPLYHRAKRLVQEGLLKDLNDSE